MLSALLAFVLVGAAAAAATNKVIGNGVRLKGSNIWFATGKAVSPKAISAKVVPTPSQAVKVQWAIVCQKPNKFDPAYHLATTVKSGVASVRGAGTVKLALPYAKPHTCVATVYATLGKNGKLTLQILEA